MSNVPQLRLYKDECLSKEQETRLQEIWNYLRDDNPKWISRNECLSLRNGDGYIIVFSVFEGLAFDHIKTLKSR